MMKTRPRIYQLLPRLFGNTNESRKPHGTLEENGVGKFADINDRALAALRDELSITHLWLTGVFAQATSTGYPEIGKPADDPALVKGRAGSPYAIKDYGDVCADYALEPVRRLEEFRELIARAHAASLKVLIDFVPNHVARSHASSVFGFGEHDDKTQFFSPQNNFFWLQLGTPPLRLPTGEFAPERESARVTGNNAATWTPSSNDWYETVKLNYGFDFTTGRCAYDPVPDTWGKMDAVLAYWQGFGVDGFRCDMAHMVPPELWRWAVSRARERQAGVFFVAEAYDNDPTKVCAGNVMVELLNAGFDAVYDDPSYKALKRIYDGPAWANDIDGSFGDERLLHRSLRYAENHDEVRIASAGNWGGHGARIGVAVSAVLWGVSCGPALMYSGQEVGEPAAGSEGYCGDNGRTTIFDYWSMPEFAKWVNGGKFDGGRLSAEQRSLRKSYGKLLEIYAQPAFADGAFYPLNPHNAHNPDFGRLPGEPASGHWLYAFARVDARTGQRFVVVVNLNSQETLRSIRVLVGHVAGSALSLAGARLADRFGNATATADASHFAISEIPPLTPAIFEILNT